jgi:predicted RNase H-like HicB family nuclease
MEAAMAEYLKSYNEPITALTDELGRPAGAVWKKANGYRIVLQITKESDGRFSAVALNLPGAGSCGDTAAEAEANAKEAILAAIESYGDYIPWTEPRLTKDTGIVKYIMLKRESEPVDDFPNQYDDYVRGLRKEGKL